MKAFIALLLISVFLFAHQVERTYPIKYVFSENENESKITKGTFELIVHVFDELYGKKLGNKKLIWTRDILWENPYIGAGSNVIDGDFYVLLYGGLARAKYMTVGALSAVLCHEFGHKLGGLPHQQFPGEAVHWSSSEGQADTFAAAHCLPQIYDRLKQTAPKLLSLQFEDVTSTLCQSAIDVQRCQWVATSGIDLIQAMQVYFETEIPFANPKIRSLERPERSLITAYPSYQCRMDIYKTYAVNPKAPRLSCWYVD